MKNVSPQIDPKCPFCNKPVNTSLPFCPYCGSKVSVAGGSLSVAQQIKIYAISVFLTPLGLYYFFKYFRNDDQQKKKVAYIALILTIVTSIILIYISMNFVSAMNSYTNQYQMEYQNLGL